MIPDRPPEPNILNAGLSLSDADGGAEESGSRSPLDRVIAPLLRSRQRGIWATIAFLSVPASLAVVAYVWFWVVPKIVRWGFVPLTPRAILSVLALVFVPTLVVLVPYGALKLTWTVLNQFADEQERISTGQIRDISERQDALEQEIEKQDPDHLIPIIRYSRIELEKYYATSLSQTQRSFRYAILAMWLGFLILTGGLALAVGWQAFGLKQAPTDVNLVILGAGAIVEFISALFLWIYRSSTAGFRYYYNRQMHTHNVLLCARIAGQMKESDATRNMIVERILSATWAVEEPGAPPGASGMKQFVSTAPASSA